MYRTDCDHTTCIKKCAMHFTLRFPVSALTLLFSDRKGKQPIKTTSLKSRGSVLEHDEEKDRWANTASTGIQLLQQSCCVGIISD